MHINQFKESKFLRKEDCGRGILVTIDKIIQENVAKEGSPEELKYCLLFREDINPMVLNITNARLIAGIVGSEDTDDWQGNQVVLYNDPSISFGGKVMGGIRVRAPKPQPAKNSPSQRVQTLVEQPPIDDSDSPF